MNPSCAALCVCLSPRTSWKQKKARTEAEAGHVVESKNGEHDFFASLFRFRPRERTNASALFLQPPQGTQAPRRMPSSFQPLAEPDEVHELALSRKSGALGHWTTSGGAAKGRREGGKSGGRRSRSALDSFYRAAGSAHPNWNLKLQPNNQTNRPVAYAPAEKERSANANAIKFAADLLAGGVAGGISKTGAFSNEDS